MATDDERREVARRLRGLDYSDLQESLICAYLDALGIEGYEDWVSIAHRLADLIEPPENAKCVAEIKIEGEQLEEIVREAAAEYAGIDRERLLAIAAVMAADSVRSSKSDHAISPVYALKAARDIAEACGETFGSIRKRDLEKWGVSVVPKDVLVDREALLALADEMDAEKNFVLVGGYARRIREALGAKS